MNKYELNEYDAALAFDMSPTLLRWLTLNGVVDKSKLSFESRNEIYYYDRNELQKLNQKMEGKWPKTPKGNRPHIPEGIKREIKREARSACPVCNKCYGEIAHIDCVATTQCNHPKNLIFLCPDHHTEYDNVLIPSNIDRKEVVTLKDGLVIFQRQLWKLQGGTIKSYLSCLNSAKSLLDVHDTIKDIIPESEFKDTLDKISKSVQSDTTSSVPDKKHLQDKSFIINEIKAYREQHQDNLCPLCNGYGHTAFYDLCPVCLGDGEVKPGTRNLIDLSPFELVECQLCDGDGVYHGNDCVACDGGGKVSQQFSDYHDWSMYDLVDCKLCKGTGAHEYEDCPACGGEGKVDQRFFDCHDWSMYDLVDCKLCKGTGAHEYEDCPACGGEGKVDQRFFDCHDWSMYDLVDCKLCKGTGAHEYEDCPACGGEGKVDQRFFDCHDWSMYDLVDCKLCKGTGAHEYEDCPACGGEGRVDRKFLDYHDWQQYL
ncbi:TPA: hypothetical protein ACPJ0D_004798 [Vibrio diabolicus]